MFKKVITKPDEEFVIRLEEDSIDLDEGEDGPSSYVYCHLENRISDSIGWLTIEDVKTIRDSLSSALAIMEEKNKELGWE